MEVGRLPEGGLADGCLELQGCLRWICAGFSPQLSWLELLSYHTKTLSLQHKAVAKGWPCAIISAPLGRKPVYCVHENAAQACDKCTCGTHKEGAPLSGGRIDSGLIPILAAQWSDALGHHFPFHNRVSFCFSLHCTFETYVWNHCKLLCAFRPSLK